MTWREEAKELGIKMYQRKKVDVLADIEAKKNPPRDVLAKIIIQPREATEICNKALYAVAVERGLVSGTITNEKFFINCKRKGIVFKGIKNDNDKLNEIETVAEQGSGTGEYVSEEED